VEVSPGIFVETLLRNSSFPDPQPIPFTPTNGYFSNLAVGEPPVASFTFSPASPLVDETVTFDASTSSDPDGTIVSWDWDFGDLATASGEIVTHSYSAADTYTVTLTVTDDDGLTDTTTQAVTVTTAPEPPVASFTYSPLSPVVGDMISFDASGSSDADGTIVSFEWNFGDSAAGTGVTAVHAYAAADTYTVTLTVTDDDGLTGTATDDVPVSPGAPIGPNFSISASPSSLAIQQGDSDVSAITVTSVEGFSDSVILSVSSLPSGATATLNPTTVTPPPYGFGNSALTLQVGLATVPGTYYLTVTGTNDTLEHSVEITLEIAERPPPYALFSHSPSEPRVNDTVAFDGSDSYDPDGTIESYEWDFGDKTIGIGKVTSHIYTKAGVYTVTLTVTNNDGTTGISTQPITIARLRSTISIAVSNTPIYVTDSVVINGTINPMRAEATVTVWCRLREEEAWNILTTVTTDENSEYSYTWTSSETGSYELKTSWTGDVDTLSAESSIENVDVNPLPVLSIGHAFFLLGVFSLACLLVVGCILVVWSLLKRRRNRTALTG
jgi:PKD repeat protein